MSQDDFIPYEGDEKYIFVSYCHDDKKKVVPIIKKLQSEGFRVWYDEGLERGEIFRPILADKIHGCEVFMIFLSKEYEGHKFFEKENSFADDENKKILPVFLEEFESTPYSKMFVKDRHSFFLYKYSNIEDFYYDLVNAKMIQSCRETNAISLVKPKRSKKKWLSIGGVIALFFVLLEVVGFVHNVRDLYSVVQYVVKYVAEFFPGKQTDSRQTVTPSDIESDDRKNISMDQNFSSNDTLINHETQSRDITLSKDTSPDIPKVKSKDTSSPLKPLVIDDIKLQNGTVGVKYSAKLKVKNNIYGVVWSVIKGNLPHGLSLNKKEGSITGTPTTDGTYKFSVRVSKNGFQSSQKNFEIKVIKAATSTSPPTPKPPIKTVTPKQTSTPGRWKLEATGTGRQLGITLNKNGTKIQGRNRHSMADDARDHFVFKLSGITAGQECDLSGVEIKKISGAKIQGNKIIFTQSNAEITAVRKH
ncbi:MAG: TIR domain-containing protein [Synergistaceae bacterium]|nr:TIR domain-containing protein [Synergistaceae bacterium]